MQPTWIEYFIIMENLYKRLVLPQPGYGMNRDASGRRDVQVKLVKF